MEIKDLIENLGAQIKNLKAFREIMLQKQKALIHIDHANLEKATLNEEKILFVIQQAEKRRINIIQELCSQYSVQTESLKLAAFVDKASSVIEANSSKEILKLEKTLKGLISEISTLNQQNKYLIENAKSFVRETMVALMNNKKSIFDRRV